MSEPTTSLSLIAFDADSATLDLFAADDCAAGAMSYLANAETLVGVEMSLPLVERADSRTILKIAPRDAAKRRIAG